VWGGIPSAHAAADDADSDFRALVESDWSLQEKRLKREPHSPAAIDAALNRASLLIADLRSMRNAPDLKQEQTALIELRRQFDSIGNLDDPARLNLYRRIRWLARQTALKNPLIAARPIGQMNMRAP
jgi:hypothetical protein